MKKGIIWAIGGVVALGVGAIGKIFISRGKEKKKQDAIENLSNIAQAEIKKNGKVSEETQKNIERVTKQ